MFPKEFELYGWVGHPDCESPTDDEKWLIANRDRMRFVAAVSDPEAFYSFDDYVLLTLDGKYWLVNTAGCSCPSPKEVWGVVQARLSKEEMAAHIRKGNYEGYTMPVWAEGVLLEALK